MWADSKIVKFLKVGSTVQKLLNFEKFPFLHSSYGKMAAIVTVQHSITFEPANKI